MERIQQQFLPLIELPQDANTLTLKQQQAILHKHEPFLRLTVTSHPVGIKGRDWFETEFSETLHAYAESLEAKLPFSTPVWHKTFNAILFSSLVAMRVVFNRVPKLSLDNIYISVADDHRIDKVEILDSTPYFSLDDSGEKVASQEALDDKLVETILALSTSLSDKFKKHKVNPRVFWGNILYACNISFSKLANQPLDEKTHLIDEMVVSEWQQNLYSKVLPKGGELNEIKKVTFNGFQKIYTRRETCCLKYKLDGKDKCATCNLHDEKTQQQLMLDKLNKAIEHAGN
ncbi:(2Fe-2S)-binding protein [Vibrio sp. D404a]|uniref:(2Fe-2S)-binding protein n=1 Tax=unclassified Vibrio TaxID=2614977 RepID=UPI0025525233|nr:MULTISPECIES: (2Fe-2S)-binding protein [unclassified Vibrio]MDK9735739.1 (2Fe-2S)-binding protein [Vibrio sp. D404a]MDK9798655.1 (2Fe-2S)-binding protein [Vibrio sp. D449a]